MMNKKLYGFCAFLCFCTTFSFAQLTLNKTSIVFQPTSEIQSDSSKVVIYNSGDNPISIKEFKFFNTYSKSAFFIKDTSDLYILPQDSLSIFVYFKPYHNIYHNSELLIITEPSAYSISIDLQGQGKYSMVYYNSTENKTEESLKTSLKSIISAGYVSLGYTVARDNMFMTIDNQKTNGQGATINTIECVYTGKKSLNYTSRTESQNNDNFNTEHTFPQGFFSQNEPMRSDLHHLFPTNDAANNSRGSYPFGVASTPYIDDAINTPSHLGSNNLYEPRNVQKGRTARAMMYFVLRYQDYSNFFSSQENILRTWHTNYPPNAIDVKRNNDIALLQKNRNPFVDYPQLIERITKIIGTSTAVNKPSIFTLDSIVTPTLSDTTDSVVVHFPIVNNGNKSVLIYNGISTSPLTNFRFDSVRVEPGETIYLPVTIYPKDTSGHFDVTLQFYTDYSIIFMFTRLKFSINNTVVGIEKKYFEDVKVYPNPTKDIIFAEVNANTPYQLFSIIGRSEMQGRLLKGKNSIDISHLNKGIYILKTKNTNTKIIKE